MIVYPNAVVRANVIADGAEESAARIVRKLTAGRRALHAVIVSERGDVFLFPATSLSVRNAEADTPDRIAGYYQPARNMRAAGITRESIAGDLLAVMP